MKEQGPKRFALIVGAMKSGTTALFEVLSQHPSVCASRVKEPDFFVHGAASGERWAEYISLWNWNEDTHKIALEASVAYTKYPAIRGVPERIASVEDADFRFIYFMRHPIRQLESHIRHAIYAGWETSIEFVPDYMLDIVRYATQLDQYARLFPREAVFLATLEEYAESPHTVLRRICRFLEIEEDFAFSRVDERYNSGRLYGIARPAAKILNTGPVNALKRTIPGSLKHAIRNRLARAVPNSRMPSPDLAENERVRVRTELFGELSRLESHYGVALRRYWADLF